MAHGELCAMTFGDMKMLVLFAVNLDSQNMVRLLLEVKLDSGLAVIVG